MEKLIFSTNNKHKLDEVASILNDKFVVLGLKDIGIDYDIPETGTTLEENALIKARYIWKAKGYNCFADDTGLEVEALDNAPGVYSARYAGEQRKAEDNVVKILTEIKDKENRKARFRTVIAAIINNEEHLFEGIVEGTITHSPRGEGGFGYDPIFQPNEYDKTFAELGDDIKNRISHRAIAIKKLCDFLSS